MGIIRELDEATVSKIAAGEVIERPSSVVKELIENALDAGSTEISILVEDGGRKRIRVSDNGAGMSPEDVPRCLGRHATSKLHTIGDLDALNTMGFRGEALYSVAAVSHMTILSRHPDSDLGYQVVVEAGRIHSQEPAPRVPGTTIDVENLFFNLPARFKYMKTARSEAQSISGIVSRFLIAWPRVAFTFMHNDVTIFQAPPEETLEDRLRLVFGADVARDVRRTEAVLKRNAALIHFTPPDITYPNRKFQMYFVNGRPVRDRTIMAAVDIAYKGLVPNARFPLAVVMLTMPGVEVDMNVHPQKHEVRFVNTHEVHSLIYRALRSQFVAAALPDPERPFTLVAAPTPGFAPGSHSGASSQDSSHTGGFGAPRHSLPALQKELKLSSPPSDASPSAPATHNFRVLGQFFNTYIFISLEGRPVFIDQHVASERILYNKLRRDSTGRPSQMLLLTSPVEVPHYVAPVLSENIERIRRVGLEIEPFGERAFVVRSILHNSGPFDALSLLVAIAEEITAAPFAMPDHALTDKLLTVAACRMAVQAGRELSMQEMTALVAEYLNEEFNRTCPHGRPILYEVSREILNTWFRRG